MDIAGKGERDNRIDRLTGVQGGPGGGADIRLFSFLSILFYLAVLSSVDDEMGGGSSAGNVMGWFCVWQFSHLLGICTVVPRERTIDGREGGLGGV